MHEVGQNDSGFVSLLGDAVSESESRYLCLFGLFDHIYSSYAHIYGIKDL